MREMSLSREVQGQWGYPRLGCGFPLVLPTAGLPQNPEEARIQQNGSLTHDPGYMSKLNVTKFQR